VLIALKRFLGEGTLDRLLSSQLRPSGQAGIIEQQR
jgi:hypothetical protein